MTEAPYPPAENPADGQVPNPPRYSASASVPVPPAPGAPGPASFSSTPGPGGATYGGMPGSPFAQGSPYPQAPAGQAPMGSAPIGQPPLGQPPLGQPPLGQPPLGQPPLGQPPAGQPAGGQVPPPAASGQARASASVPLPGSPPPSYGNPPAPAAASYAPATFGSAPAGYSGPPAAFGQPPQFDGPGGGMFGQPPAANPAGGSAGGPPPGTTYGAPGGQGYGSAPAGYAPPQGYAPERGSAPAAQYGQGVYGSAAGDAGRGSEPEWPGQAPERKPKRGLIIALIVTAVLVVVGVGAYVGWSMKNSSSEFKQGACVQQRGGDAAIVDCSVSGAYKIDSIVDTEGGCPDANQPSLVLTPRGGGATQYGCLVPASGS